MQKVMLPLFHPIHFLISSLKFQLNLQKRCPLLLNKKHNKFVQKLMKVTVTLWSIKGAIYPFYNAIKKETVFWVHKLSQMYH